MYTKEELDRVAKQFKSAKAKKEIAVNLSADSTVGLAAIIEYIYDRIRAVKSALLSERPKSYEIECKMLNRMLDYYLSEHERIKQYKTDREMQDELRGLVDWLHEETDLNVTYLYYSLRNEIINSPHCEDMIETTIQCRILALCIRSLDKILYANNVALGQEFVNLLNVLDCVSKDYEDRGGHQALAVQIFESKINKLMVA